MRNYYTVLGVLQNAPQHQIKRAFRNLARQYHPDLNPDAEEKAADRFKEINEAYEVLGDVCRRRQYDAMIPRMKVNHPVPHGGATVPPPPASDAESHFDFGGTGFSDFFDTTFGSGSFHKAYRPEPQDAASPRRGTDLETDLLVTLHEVLHGGEKKISIKRKDGPHAGKKEILQIKIPRGVRHEQTIRVLGKGRTGLNGGESGDLLLHIRYALHPDFEPKGLDLHYELELAPWEAALGDSITVPTLDRPVSITIRPGTQPGKQLRLKGLGLPNGDREERGDILATIRVAVPEEDTLPESDRKLWLQLRAGSTWNPRA